MADKYFAHTFHIPVMGIGYSIDTAVKVAPFGISSVISLVDDLLFEKMREFYCKQLDVPFQAITKNEEDFRAKRITAYLNLINTIVTNKFEDIKNDFASQKNNFEKYFMLLPKSSILKQSYLKLESAGVSLADIWRKLKDKLVMGNIDVNIMTKLDKENYKNGKKLPVYYNDAHSALRGFAKSNLKSSIVLSAGMNRRLYTYFEDLNDFFPDENLVLNKKITLKVTDFRSAMIQGRFFAQKGLWVSEFRIESGLNCGGHTFPSDGILMGPILQEFKEKRQSLISTFFDAYTKALQKKGKHVPYTPYPIRITAQGGIGTYEEHEFLMKYYDLDAVGWGSPFLMVPEVVNIDRKTLELLKNAKEDDYFLSDISPLGVKFNTIKGNSKDLEREKWIKQGTPGSICPKQYLISNTEFTEKPICTASRQYQKLKITELKTKKLSESAYREQFKKITEKTCICVGLGTSALINNNLDYTIEGSGVSICPGPNLAYYTKEISFQQMVDHIYGKKCIDINPNRPNLFLKELTINFNHLKEKINKFKTSQEEADKKSLKQFYSNLHKSLDYYKTLFENVFPAYFHKNISLTKDLSVLYNELNDIGKFITV